MIVSQISDPQYGYRANLPGSHGTHGEKVLQAGTVGLGLMALGPIAWHGSGIVRFGASLALTALTQPIPSDNVLMMSKDKWIKRAGVVGGIYGAALMAQLVYNRMKGGYHGMQMPWWLEESRGGQGSSLPSIPGVANGRSIPSPSATASGARLRGRGSPRFSGGRDAAPYCRVHKKRHWCKYTKR